jgi:hypothetical protein
MESDPTRWIDDPEVEPALRDDLARLASVRASSIDVSAGAERLEAAIRTGAGGSGAGGLGGIGPWIVGAVIAVAAGGALLWWALSDRDPPPEPEVAAAPAPVVVVPRASEPTEEPTTVPQAQEALPDEEPSTPQRRRPRVRAEVPEPEIPAPPAPPPSLQEEMELLGRTRGALRGDPARALALAEEGQRRFPPPHGVYREEREAIAILALADLGRRDEARRRSERFLLLYPDSPMSGRVRRAVAPP